MCWCRRQFLCLWRDFSVSVFWLPEVLRGNNIHPQVVQAVFEEALGGERCRKGLKIVPEITWRAPVKTHVTSAAWICSWSTNLLNMSQDRHWSVKSSPEVMLTVEVFSFFGNARGVQWALQRAGQAAVSNQSTARGTGMKVSSGCHSSNQTS